MTDLICPNCGEDKDIKGHDKAMGRWRCNTCGRRFRENYKRHGVFSQNTRCIGDHPMSGAERTRKCRSKKKRVNNNEDNSKNQ